jgi:hypothetical protein
MHHRFVQPNLERASGPVAIFVVMRESQAVCTDRLIASLDTVVQEIVDV